MLKGLRGEELTGNEGFRMTIFSRTVIRQWQSAYYQYQNSALNEQVLIQMESQIGDILLTDPDLYDFWESTKSA